VLLGRSRRNIVVDDVSFRFYGFAEWRGPRPGLGLGIGIQIEIEAGCNGREIRCQNESLAMQICLRDSLHLGKK